MKKLIIYFIVFLAFSLYSKERTVFLYELTNSKISKYGEKLLSPYTFEIKNQDTEIKNFLEIFKFLALKKDSLYSNSEIVNTPLAQKKLLTDGIVTVKLSKEALKNFEEVSSEIIYSLTENGAKGVLFSNIKENKKIFTRNDVPFTSFVLFIPYSNVLPPNNLTSGFIKLENGKVLQADEFYKKIKKGDGKINKMIVSLIKKGSKVQKINAMKSLPYTKIKNTEKLLIPNLDSKDNEIVMAALDGLMGKKSKKLLKKLEDLLKNNTDDLIKLNSAKTLIASGNKKFIISGLKYFLDSSDIGAKKDAVKSIAKHKNAEEILLMMLDDKNTEIKLTVLEYLKTAKKKKTFEKLKEILKDKSPKIRLIASNILLTNKSYRKYGLFYQLKSNDKNLSLSAAKELEKYKGDDTVNELITCLSDCKYNDTVFAAAETLLKFKEKKALLPFFKRLSEMKTENKSLTESFLKLFNTDELLKILKENKNLLLSLNIINYFGKIGKDKKDEKIISTIVPFLKSDKENIRLACVKSLNMISGEKAFEYILTVKDDTSEKIRMAVLVASENHPKDKIKDLLLKYLNDSSDDIRLKSMDLIIKNKVTEAEPYLKQYIGSSIKRVKLKALETLVSISEKISSEMEEKFQELLDQDDDEIRVWAIYGLAKTRKKPNLPFITPYGSSDLPKVRKAVMYAVGELDDENNTKIDMLYGGLEDDDESVRIEAAKSIAKIGQKKDIEKINKIITEIKDKKVKELLKSALNTIKNRTSED